MKPRRIIITIEAETAMKVKEIEDYVFHNTDGHPFTVKQIQVNVIRPEKGKK